MEQSTYSLVVSFPDQSASFVHGFEAGRIDEQMRRGDVAELRVTTHRENREVIRRMAVAQGWKVETEKCVTPEWEVTTLRKVASAPERPNPHGLHVVAAPASQGERG